MILGVSWGNWGKWGTGSTRYNLINLMSSLISFVTQKRIRKDSKVQLRIAQPEPPVTVASKSVMSDAVGYDAATTTK